ncbi:hypothetical protein [Pseudomonas phage D6]|nr:hypothetical protein [Pseudomonas phage D6]
MDFGSKALLSIVGVAAAIGVASVARISIRTSKAILALKNMEVELDVNEFNCKHGHMTRSEAETKIDLIIDRYKLAYLHVTLEERKDAEEFFERCRVGRKKLLEDVK